VSVVWENGPRKGRDTQRGRATVHALPGILAVALICIIARHHSNTTMNDMANQDWMPMRLEAAVGA